MIEYLGKLEQTSYRKVIAKETFWSICYEINSTVFRNRALVVKEFQFASRNAGILVTLIIIIITSRLPYITVEIMLCVLLQFATTLSSEMALCRVSR